MDWERSWLGTKHRRQASPDRQVETERLARYLELTGRLRRQGADLVVWGELVVTKGVPSGGAERFLQDLFGGPLQVPTVFGAMVVDTTERGVRGFNSALALDRSGQLVARYNKQVLFPFGEYIPFVDRLPVLRRLLPNAGDFGPGSNPTFGSLGHHSLAALICYEAIFPAYVNEVVRASRPEMIFNLSNDTWFGDTTEPWIHLALSQSRAIEHRRYLVRAANTGVSAVIDAGGRVVAHADPSETRTLLVPIHWMHGATVYELVGDVPWWICALVVAMMAAAPTHPKLMVKWWASHVKGLRHHTPGRMSGLA